MRVLHSCELSEWTEPFKDEHGRVRAMDRYVVVCNYVNGRNNARAGAKATICWTTGGAERVQVTVISLGGRRVTQWERLDRLHNFRVQTVVDDHHPQNAAVFETREEAQQEALRWMRMQAEQQRPRNQHDPGDEDRRPA